MLLGWRSAVVAPAIFGAWMCISTAQVTGDICHGNLGFVQPPQSGLFTMASLSQSIPILSYVWVIYPNLASISPERRLPGNLKESFFEP